MDIDKTQGKMNRWSMRPNEPPPPYAQSNEDEDAASSKLESQKSQRAALK